MAFCTKSEHILPSAVIMLTFSWFCGSQSFFFCVCVCSESHLTAKGMEVFGCFTAFHPVCRDHIHGYGDKWVLPKSDSLNLLEKSTLFLSITSRGSLRQMVLFGCPFFCPIPVLPEHLGICQKTYWALSHLAEPMGLMWPSDHHLKGLGSSTPQ